MMRQAQRSRYFQEIAQAFFDLRGAPFVLSSRDMVTISVWEETGIPLRVVLEGIQRGFEVYRKRQPQGRKIPSLSFCNAQVLKAFAEFRDRGVGRRRKEGSREAKKRRAKLEVERFLQSLAPGAGYLEGTYREALGILSRRAVNEERLESLQSEAEELILRHAQETERARVEHRIKENLKGRPESEVQELCRIQLVKTLREKHRIPHLSLFYY
jgi:hypothetical protein